MALLTDGNPSTIEDLRCYESSLLEVARVEQIDLDGKLTLAAAEVGDQVESFLLRHPSQDPQGGSRRQLGLSNVVVTEPVKRWHALQTLAMVFSDAFGSQLNERYEAKRNQYTAAAERAKRHAFEYGIGLVCAPVPRASTPICSSVLGAASSATSFVSVSWIGAQEGAASFPTTFETAAGTVLAVTSGTAPSAVTAFNVYVGATRESISRQNSDPLMLGETWVSTGAFSAGAAPTAGRSFGSLRIELRNGAKQEDIWHR